jgi:hypothetical protein
MIPRRTSTPTKRFDQPERRPRRCKYRTSSDLRDSQVSRAPNSHRGIRVRSAQIVGAMPTIIKKFNNCQDELIALVERIWDFVFGHRDSIGPGHATLYLQEAQLAGTKNAALDRKGRVPSSWTSSENSALSRKAGEARPCRCSDAPPGTSRQCVEGRTLMIAAFRPADSPASINLHHFPAGTFCPCLSSCSWLLVC